MRTIGARLLVAAVACAGCNIWSFERTAPTGDAGGTKDAVGEGGGADAATAPDVGVGPPDSGALNDGPARQPDATDGQPDIEDGPVDVARSATDAAIASDDAAVDLPSEGPPDVPIADGPADVPIDLAADAPVDRTADVPLEASTPSPCTDVEIKVNNPELKPLCPREVCDGITCDRTPSGALLMSYAISCGDAARAWAVCEFSVGQDLSAFDAAYTGSGFLEAVFCVEGGTLRGGLNLWYGRHPLRKKLELVPADGVLMPGCYVRYFSPAQAKFPEWEGIPSTCWGQCGAGKAGCSTDFRAAIATYASTDAGGPDNHLNATRVQLAAEGCSGASTGRVRLTSVRLLSSGCRCAGAADCAGPGRPTCRLAQPSDCAAASSSFSVCGPASFGCAGPPGAGVACTVMVGAQTCHGISQCVDGMYVCPFTACD